MAIWDFEPYSLAELHEIKIHVDKLAEFELGFDDEAIRALDAEIEERKEDKEEEGKTLRSKVENVLSDIEGDQGWQIADAIFDALKITPVEQGIEGGEVSFYPFPVVCPKCEHGFMSDESLEERR